MPQSGIQVKQLLDTLKIKNPNAFIRLLLFLGRQNSSVIHEWSIGERLISIFQMPDF
jgi:hypothetical protein